MTATGSGVIPADAELMEFEFSGRPLVELGDDSAVFAAVSEMMQKIVSY
jgi:CO dehydrogenase nickel-insertion accessory protein CooC1